jgi:ribosomal protein L7/L12
MNNSKKTEIVLIVSLLMFLTIGVIALFFMITTSAEVPFYAWVMPISFIFFPIILLKDFATQYFQNPFVSKNKNIALSKNKVKYVYLDKGNDILINNCTIQKKILKDFLNKDAKLEAIKYLIETTKIDLLSAKSCIEKLINEGDLTTIIENNTENSTTGSGINIEKIKQLLNEGRKMEAVQYYMKVAKVGMGTAKNFIDSI